MIQQQRPGSRRELSRVEVVVEVQVEIKVAYCVQVRGLHSSIVSLWIGPLIATGRRTRREERKDMTGKTQDRENAAEVRRRVSVNVVQVYSKG